MGGQSGSPMKDQVSLDLASEFGAQRASFKTCVLWDSKGSNPITTLLYSRLNFLP